MVASLLFILWEFALCLGPTKKQTVLSLFSTLFLRGEVRTSFQSDLTMFPSFCGFQSAPCSLVEEFFFFSLWFEYLRNIL